MRDDEETNSVIVAFRCNPALATAAEAAAAAEGLSRSDIARRALLRDLGLVGPPVARPEAS
jgi:hypothetical protein